MIRHAVIGAAAVVAVLGGYFGAQYSFAAWSDLQRLTSEVEALRRSMPPPVAPAAGMPAEAAIRQLETRLREADERFAALRSLLAAADARDAGIDAAIRGLTERLALVERATVERLPPLERAIAERLPALERSVGERLAALDRQISERIAALERRPSGGGADLQRLAAQLALLRDELDTINDRLALEQRR